jgi:hypothetical protein
MSRTLRRFELLLPLRFNDGQPVPDDLIAETLIELETQFGAVSCETQPIRGLWHYEGQPFRDDLVRVFVDVADLPENRQFFVEYKDRLKARFQQLDIWLATHAIEVL